MLLLHLLCSLVFLREHLLRLRWRDGSIRDSRVGEGTQSMRFKKWHVHQYVSMWACICANLWWSVELFYFILDCVSSGRAGWKRHGSKMEAWICWLNAEDASHMRHSTADISRLPLLQLRRGFCFMEALRLTLAPKWSANRAYSIFTHLWVQSRYDYVSEYFSDFNILSVSLLYPPTAGSSQCIK